MTKNNEVIVLRGSKTHLRLLEETDIDRLLAWFNDPEVAQYLGMYLPLMRIEEKEWLAKLHKEKQTHLGFGIVAGKRNVHIGTIGLHGIHWRNRTATLGISIGDKRFWNKGHGTEAMRLLICYAFSVLNLRKVCLSVVSFNDRAKHVYEKCGFVVEGCRREQLFARGQYQDEIMMAVFRE